VFIIVPNGTDIPLDIGTSYFTFKHEIPNATIEAFCSLGSKSYCITYSDINGQHHNVMKISGFNLTSSVSKNQLPPEKYQSLVFDYLNGKSQTEWLSQEKKSRNKKTRILQSELCFRKLSNNVFDKRISFLLDKKNSFTLPIGFTKEMLHCATKL
jgi:hypothetical protein